MTIPRSKSLTVQDLPAEIEIDLPDADLGLPWCIGIVGAIVLAVGVLTLIFGPSTIRYNMLTGMTFLQMIQAYPGPITTAGFLIVGLAQMMGNSIASRHAESLQALLLEKIAILDEDIPAGFALAIEPKEYPRFEVKLVELPAQGEAPETAS